MHPSQEAWKDRMTLQVEPLLQMSPEMVPPGQTGPQFTAHLLELELLGLLHRKG